MISFAFLGPLFPMKTEETPTAKFYVKDGIVHSIYKNAVNVDIEDIRVNFEVRQKMQNGTPMLALVDVREVWEFSEEARAFAASDELKSLSIAMAVITGNSTPVRMVANFFMRMNKPKTPTRLFSNYEDTYNWLKNKL